MIYNVLNKINYFNKNPLFGFILSCIVYILAHAFLYSNRCPNNEFVNKNKSVIYSLVLCDIALFYANMKKIQTDKNKEKTKNKKIIYRKKKCRKKYKTTN